VQPAQSSFSSIDFALHTYPFSGERSALPDRYDVSRSGSGWKLDRLSPISYNWAVDNRPKSVLVYRTREGRLPFDEWLRELRDQNAVARVLARIGRIRLGNLGDCKPVGAGVSELRVDYGPGYRVYFGQKGATLVILLCGGDKRSQKRDIRLAQEYWNDYENRERK